MENCVKGCALSGTASVLQAEAFRLSYLMPRAARHEAVHD